MKEETRRAIAHAAVPRISGNPKPNIYSYERGTHSFFSGRGAGGYYYEVGARVSRTGDKLFHYGTGGHIKLTVSGKAFSGFDYSSGHHYRGTVNGNRGQKFYLSSGVR